MRQPPDSRKAPASPRQGLSRESVTSPQAAESSTLSVPHLPNDAATHVPAYAARGWSVHQCHGLRGDGVTCTCRKGASCGRSTAKHPVDSAWQTETRTAGEVADDLARRPWAHNVGIVTGEASGVWVLDVDPKDGGYESLAALEAEHGALPDTYRVRTGSGGLHVYYSWPGFPVGNSVKRLGPGLDVRGTGGQVVAPPSVTPQGSYTVLDDATVAAAPSWLLDLVRPQARPESERTVSTGPVAADLHPYAATVVADELGRLDECVRRGWDGEPWDATAYAVACNLLELANSPWSGYTREQAHADLLQHAPRDEGFTAEDHEAKWSSAVAKVGDAGRPEPTGSPAVTFMARKPAQPTAEPATVEPDRRVAFTDAHLADRVGRDVLAGRFCWTAGLGWLAWDGRRWAQASEAAVLEAVRLYFIDLHASQARHGAGMDVLQALTRLLSRNRITAVVALARGVVLADAAAFDQHPDLLNVGNGVVNLRTSALSPHDPALLLTKVTEVDYDPAATSADWNAAQDSLPSDVRAYLQVRVGQAATGHTPPDDVMPVLQGGGSNGKTLLTGAVQEALGEHAVLVSDRVLLASPDAHPTELMDLRGARFALIEETPEARRLSVARLKKAVGTPFITARHIRQDSVTFRATHSLWLTSNYRPQVEEVDDGTWRRLQLVLFPFTYRAPGATLRSASDRHGDSGLRQRLRTQPAAQRAVLRWIVDGARAWYDADRVMPPAPARVAADTLAWRVEADHVLGYLTERLVFDRDCYVMGTDLLGDYNAWAESCGRRPWSDQTLSERFGGHGHVVSAGVEKRRTSNSTGLSRPSIWTAQGAPPRAMSWVGVRFRTGADDAADTLATAPWQGWQGSSDNPSFPRARGSHPDTPATPATPSHTDSRSTP